MNPRHRPTISYLRRGSLVTGALGIVAGSIGLLGVAIVPPGCAIAGYAAAMAREARKNKTHEVEAVYQGLAGKTFAVVVVADRYTQSDHPMLVPTMTAEITARLRDGVGHAGHIPAETLLRYLYEHPRWVAMPRGRLAQDLGVDRLVWIDVLDYHLNEPGNPYVWDGVAAGTMGIVDPTSAAPDEFVFERTARVGFPDKTNLGKEEMDRDYVNLRLLQRFIDRTSWPLYKHTEPLEPEY
jgi:hypothetical protein